MSDNDNELKGAEKKEAFHQAAEAKIVTPALAGLRHVAAPDAPREGRSPSAKR